MRLGLGLIAIAGVATVIRTIRRQLIVITVYGHSMQPSLQPGDRVLIRRSTGLQRQQVAVFAHRSELEGAEPVLLIKRVAAVAGDPIPPSVHAHTASRVVPPGSVVLLGDNPQHSFDSRDIGLVCDDQIVGVVIRRLAHTVTRRHSAATNSVAAAPSVPPGRPSSVPRAGPSRLAPAAGKPAPPRLPTPRTPRAKA